MVAFSSAIAMTSSSNSTRLEEQLSSFEVPSCPWSSIDLGQSLDFEKEGEGEVASRSRACRKAEGVALHSKQQIVNQ